MFLVGGMSHENLDVFFPMFFFFFFLWEDFTSLLNGDLLGIFNNNNNGDVEGDGERDREREREWGYTSQIIAVPK